MYNIPIYIYIYINSKFNLKNESFYVILKDQLIILLAFI